MDSESIKIISSKLVVHSVQSKVADSQIDPKSMHDKFLCSKITFLSFHWFKCLLKVKYREYYAPLVLERPKSILFLFSLILNMSYY